MRLAFCDRASSVIELSAGQADRYLASSSDSPFISVPPGGARGRP
jgi:hypothetical protein